MRVATLPGSVQQWQRPIVSNSAAGTDVPRPGETITLGEAPYGEQHRGHRHVGSNYELEVLST